MDGLRPELNLITVIATLIAAIGCWVLLAPFVVPDAEFVATHIVVGGLIAILGGGYAFATVGDPALKISSMWLVLALGGLLLLGAVLGHTHGTAFFWSTVIASGAVILLAGIALLWNSRFLAGRGTHTTIFEG